MHVFVLYIIHIYSQHFYFGCDSIGINNLTALITVTRYVKCNYTIKYYYNYANKVTSAASIANICNNQKELNLAFDYCH